MKVSEADLLKSGFTDADLKKIKNNLESYGGTLGEAVADLKTDSGCCYGLFLAAR